MLELHQEQASLRRARRKYELPDIRTGDVVKVTYYESYVPAARAASFAFIRAGSY